MLPQWFISMDKENLLNNVKEVVEDVEWLPSWGKVMIDSMLSSSPDWCVSRQRTWGVPITLFIHKETQDIHPNTPELMIRLLV